MDMKAWVSFQMIQNAPVCRKLVPQMFLYSTGILNYDKSFHFSVIRLHCIMPLSMDTAKLFNCYYHMELLWI